ncbi:serine/threonine-protein kinase [Streptomyces sp. NPDC006739]|uniref:serine/threonine-protein kinase n=1 Tax=Streptomyces sp. NPDC006739 TaxID=3364763 RepID=UPI0036B9B415
MQPLTADEPAVIGPYRLLGRLGSGGMGRVYLGRSAGGRTVAVKIVHPHFALDEEFRARFRREVEAARKVGGAWTAPVLDADPDAAVPWVATAYVAGPSLAAAVEAHGPLPTPSVRALVAGLAEALAAVHDLGLVHRDVKPSNVLLTLDGPLLIDFGIARATGGTASLTSSGVSVGSPGYMSPEQILGRDATGAADVFSLGAVLAYAATGSPPFPGDSSAALLYKVVHEEPELGTLGGDLREVAAACLAKEPGLRPTPGELSRRLAPEGAARLVTDGWLPGSLVEQVSRSAVQLLNLETTEGPRSGPVTFSSPSVGGTDARAGGSAGGSAGSAGGSAGSAGEFGSAPAMPSQRPGKVSVTVAAGSTPGEGGRGRRVSCTLALAVTGALAVVTVGMGFLLRPWFDAGDTSGGSAAGASPSSTLSSPTQIPTRYLGTWQGRATALDGNLPIGTFRLTVHQAATGQELGRLRQTDQLGGTCTDVLTLKQVTPTNLIATSLGAAANHPGCDRSPTTVELTPVADNLKYTSDSTAEGNPVAVLSRVG